MNWERKSLLAVKRGARLFFQRRGLHFGKRIFGQNARLSLDSPIPFSFMLWSLFARRAAICFCWGLFLGIPAAVFAQNYYTTNGMEYAIVGSLPGDQVFPDVAVTPNGGFVVWQDNITDGSGWGVSAMRLVGGTLSGSDSSFRVNVQGTNDQANARVALLQNGGAVFVWQGGKPSQEQIYARFLSPTNTWLTGDDVPVSAQSITNAFVLYGYATNTTTTVITNRIHGRITGYITNTTTTVIMTATTNTTVSPLNFQINPAVTTLADGNVVIVWGSYNQAGANSLLDVYGQILSPAGEKIGAEFLINQFITYNQRTPTVAALANGGFVVAWVSEQERVRGVPYSTPPGVTPSQMAYPSVDIYARLYDANGNPQSDEFLVNTDSNPCANPAVAAGSDGGFVVAWDAKDMTSRTNSLDIYARSFTSAGPGSGSTVVRVNTYLYGDQYAPRISSLGTDYLITWTSLAQDGSREGVYAQFLRGNGSEFGGEFRVTTTTISSQMQPAVASDGVNQFLVVWTSYTGLANGFDLFAQRYQNVNDAVLQPMAAPFVWAPFVLSNNVYQPQLQVSWSALAQQGISVSNYEVYVNGAASPTALTMSNVWTMTAANGLTAGSSNSFQVDYVTTDGRRSSISAAASGTTWANCNYMNSGVPCGWIAEMYTTNPWPSNVNAPIVPGGPTVYQVFLSGGNPLDPSTWLQTALTRTSQGQFYLSWNTQPGLTYQVQMTTDFASWSVVPNGSARFAAGTIDGMYVGSGPAGYYRIVLLRQ
jgi:hypothetical protein